MISWCRRTLRALLHFQALLCMRVACEEWTNSAMAEIDRGGPKSDISTSISAFGTTSQTACVFRNRLLVFRIFFSSAAFPAVFLCNGIRLQRPKVLKRGRLRQGFEAPKYLTSSRAESSLTGRAKGGRADSLRSTTLEPKILYQGLVVLYQLHISYITS